MKRPVGMNKRQWKKWSPRARQVFSDLFSMMTKNPSLFRHPQDTEVSSTYFKTTAWNAAWMAADFADGRM